MSTMKEVREEIAVKSRFLHEVYEAAGADLDLGKVKALDSYGATEAKVAELKRRNDELADLNKKFGDLRSLEGGRGVADELHRAMNTPADGGIQHPGAADGVGKREQKSLGRLFVESAEYKAFDGHKAPALVLPDLNLKTVFRTGAGWDPESMRIPRLELSAQRPIAIIDTVPLLNTGTDTIRYMLETTLTNNAAEKAESTATTGSDIAGEAALALTEQTMPVEWLPVFIPVTKQQMADVVGIEDYVNQRLQYMLRARVDSQILNGDGSTPNLKGTLNIGGSLQTQAKGSDPTPDAIYKAMTKVRATGYAEPSVIFAHPNDWQDIRLLRTADGVYIFGSPQDPGADRIWGKPVVVSTAVVENTIILGDYAGYSAMFMRQGVTLSVSDSHAYYFTRGMLAILAEMRLAMVHFRTSAFATVTGV